VPRRIPIILVRSRRFHEPWTIIARRKFSAFAAFAAATKATDHRGIHSAGIDRSRFFTAQSLRRGICKPYEYQKRISPCRRRGRKAGEGGTIGSRGRARARARAKILRLDEVSRCFFSARERVNVTLPPRLGVLPFLSTIAALRNLASRAREKQDGRPEEATRVGQLRWAILKHS